MDRSALVSLGPGRGQLSSLSVQPARMTSFTQSDGFDRCGQVDVHLPGRSEWRGGQLKLRRAKGKKAPGEGDAWPVLTQETRVAWLCPQVLQIPGESSLAFTLGPFHLSGIRQRSEWEGSCLAQSLHQKKSCLGAPSPPVLGGNARFTL